MEEPNATPTQCESTYERASITIAKVVNGYFIETRQREEFIAININQAIDIVKNYFGEA